MPDAFLEAFKYAPNDAKLKENFDTMMRHFHGQDKRYLESIVRARMRYLADRDAEEQRNVADFFPTRQRLFISTL